MNYLSGQNVLVYQFLFVLNFLCNLKILRMELHTQELFHPIPNLLSNTVEAPYCDLGVDKKNRANNFRPDSIRFITGVFGKVKVSFELNFLI